MRYLLLDFYRKLLDAFGPQQWWPGETPLEVVVGAVLTQNTAWLNVERAIKNLKSNELLSFEALETLSAGRLAELIRPAGYFNIKAARLKNLIRLLRERYDGDVLRLRSDELSNARAALLSVSGVGPETADSILLYALGKPVFVVDAYTRRVFSRHGFFAAALSYERIRGFFESALPRDAQLFNEYHALLVKLGKDCCRPWPLCAVCPVCEVFAAMGRPVRLRSEQAG